MVGNKATLQKSKDCHHQVKCLYNWHFFVMDSAIHGGLMHPIKVEVTIIKSSLCMLSVKNVT